MLLLFTTPSCYVKQKVPTPTAQFCIGVGPSMLAEAIILSTFCNLQWVIPSWGRLKPTVKSELTGKCLSVLVAKRKTDSGVRFIF
jgi:hypothetical protein